MTVAYDAVMTPAHIERGSSHQAAVIRLSWRGITVLLSGARRAHSFVRSAQESGTNSNASCRDRQPMHRLIKG